MKRKIWFFVLVACMALIGAVSVQAQQKLEIFSWWADGRLQKTACGSFHHTATVRVIHAAKLRLATI